MRFASLIDKQTHPHAWYTLGLSQVQRWWAAVGVPLDAMLILHAEVGLEAIITPVVHALVGYALIALAVAALIAGH